MRRAARLFGSLFGIGRLPGAPGTWGSAAALLAVAFVPGDLYPWVVGALAAAATLLGPAIADRAISPEEPGDPSWFVLDEAAGLWIACFRLDHPGWVGLLAGFAFFRLFDVLKPGPVRRAERLPGGRGVVYDDVVAGLIALPLSMGAQALLG